MHAAQAQSTFVERCKTKSVGFAIANQRNAFGQCGNHVGAVVGVIGGSGKGRGIEARPLVPAYVGSSLHTVFLANQNDLGSLLGGAVI